MQPDYSSISRSNLFTAYNAARKLAREGQLDRGRVNRALGVAQRSEPRPYVTTPTTCTCPDFTGRDPKTGRQFKAASTKPCKHIIALALQDASRVAPAMQARALPVCGAWQPVVAQDGKGIWYGRLEPTKDAAEAAARREIATHGGN